MTRSETTIENLGTTLTFPAAAASSTRGRVILAGHENTKWMNPNAAIDYTAAIAKGKPYAAAALEVDPHTRRAVIHGPQGACWIATQVISDPANPGCYKVFAFFRSLDKDHVQADLDMQSAIAHMFVDRISTITLFATCYHEYL